ncbi:MAG: hypothetical protein WAK48_12560 [Candidatus Acidiferrum sp.]
MKTSAKNKPFTAPARQHIYDPARNHPQYSQAEGRHELMTRAK